MRYEVFVNGTLLYDSFLVNEKELQILSPVLTVNEEGGSFTFTLPKSHILWNTLASHFGNSDAYVLFTRKTDTIVINRDGKWLWEGYISNFEEDLDGSYSVTCSGALTYLKNIRCPLSVVLNRTRDANETRVSHFENSFRRLVKKVLRQYNDRLNDFKSVYNIDLSYQKIYYVGGKSRIDIPSDIAVPKQFRRISNYDECYELLDRFASDFGGHFYLTRYYAHTMTASYYGPNDAQGNPKTGDATIDIQDDSITSDVTRDILVINFKADSNVIDNAVVHMGNHLLEYNVSDSFELATSVIPRGAQYGDKWRLREAGSLFADTEQYSSLQWSQGQYRYIGPDKYSAEGGCRIFLPNLTDSDLEIAKKIGMKDVVVDFGDDVVAKFPERHGELDDGTYGFPLSSSSHLSTDSGRPYCSWFNNKTYYAGDVVYDGAERTLTGGADIYVYAYVCRHTHRSSYSIPITDAEYWEQMGLVGINYRNNDYVYDQYPPSPGHQYWSGGAKCLGNDTLHDGKTVQNIRYSEMDFITSWHYYIAATYPLYSANDSYTVGDKRRYTIDGIQHLYQARVTHTDHSGNSNPRNSAIWQEIPFGWASIDDYLNAPNVWYYSEEESDTRGGTAHGTVYRSDFSWWYHEDYTRALRILGLNYLQNQQFDDLELSITSDMVTLDDAISEVNYDPDDDSKADLALWYMHIGDQLPVSANLFGDNLKPYPILEVSFELSDDSSSTITLGKKTSDLTVLIRNKES